MWREERADRLEALVLTDLFAAGKLPDPAERRGREGGGLKALSTLLRYRARIERERAPGHAGAGSPAPAPPRACDGAATKRTRGLPTCRHGDACRVSQRRRPTLRCEPNPSLRP